MEGDPFKFGVIGMSDFEKLYERVNQLFIVDTHQHLAGYELKSWDPQLDVINGMLVTGYNRTTLCVAGMKCDWVPSGSVVERWKEIEPYWEDCRYTGYMQCTQQTVQDLFGIPKITVSTIETLNELFLNSLKAGIYNTIFREKSRIAVSLVDCAYDCDKSLFRSVYHVDRFIKPAIEQDLWEVEQDTGLRIRTIEDWMQAFEMDLENKIQKGIVGLKCALAYVRPLHFKRASYNDARRDFDRMYAHRFTPSHFPEKHSAGTAFQDYMMHHICKIAERLGLTFQIHTGILEGITNHLGHSNPELLNNLFVEYPDLKFDLFHISYPYQNIAGALAKMFPNVYLDMCWAHIISPEASITALSEWIELLPSNKISAFGSDFVGGVPHLVYGHAKMARRHVCKALCRKIESGLMDLDEAFFMAKKMLYDNPASLFGLDGLGMP